jgi:hypothetical protein
MKAADVKAALKRRHGVDGTSGEWVAIEEAFCGWASSGGGIDLLAIGAWKSAKVPGCPGSGRGTACHPVVAYEVKVSRADYRREILGYEPGPDASYRTRAVPPWPGKAFWALRRSHYFFFAVPEGLLTEEELARREPDGRKLWVPPEAGVVTVSARGCHVAVPARQREAEPLVAAEVAELIRHAVDPNRERKLREEVRSLAADRDYWRGVAEHA